MKDAIYYYYDIYVDKFNTEENISFFYNGYKYYYLKWNRKITEINGLVDITDKMFSNGVVTYTFIKNKFNEYYSYCDSKIYILFRVNELVDNSINIKLDDILKFNNSYVISNDVSFDILDWKSIWKNNLDKFEMLIADLEIENLTVFESFDYFLGLGENSVSYLNNLNRNYIGKLCVTHNRINKNDFYNPTCYLIDYYVRDLAEYFKVKILNYSDIYMDLCKLIENKYFDYYSCVLLFSRMLYPSYYLDAFYSSINGEKVEVDIKAIIKNSKYYRTTLFKCNSLFNKWYNLPIIGWLIM